MQSIARLALHLFATVALCAVAAPAVAQAPGAFGAARFSKTEAILGGSPSSLAAIIASQSQSSGAMVALSAFAAPLPAAFPYYPPAPFGLDAPPPIDRSASLDRPDIFNSVALPIARSSLDRRWNRVGSATVAGRPALYASRLRAFSERTRIETINAYVNSRILFVDDSRQFGVSDRWSPAAETLARGRGDCEDFALAKMAMLRRAGLAERDLYFVVLKDVARRADHAVLVVRSEGRFLVLDNGTDRLIDSADMPDYRPILTFSAGQRFTHGYRRAIPALPVMLAAASPDLSPVAAVSMSSLLPSWSVAMR